MKSTFNLSTRARLFLGFGVIIISVIIIVLVMLRNISESNTSQILMIRSFDITRSLTQLRSDENRIRAMTLEMIISKDVIKKDTLQKAIFAMTAEVQNRVKTTEQLLENSPSELNQFKEIESQMSQYRENRKTQISLILQGKSEEAMAFASNVQNSLYENIRSRILALEKDLDTHSREMVTGDDALARTELITLTSMGVGMIILSLVLVGWMLRMLRKIAEEISPGVNILGTSASEILATVTEVSTSATETATAVSETTTTMEEIRQTSMMANQKAQSVLESAQRASDAAENGKESVQQTIDGMNKINQQMTMIADRVVKLSEQNRSVGEITSTVNDIADQSNLLAVNAAIEAAKAGEQGRGFAVVALEIRSLAEQSKQATAQVREILNEIQKAVGQAVLATEQGSKAVENGSNLARHSGEMIDILADTVRQAAQSVIQISATSQQQMNGMDQIVPAMENIKQASEQNVSGTRQTQLAAYNLNELGQKLKAIVEKFNV